MTRNVLFALFAWAALPASGAQMDWNAVVRRDHPRLFFNRDTWPAVKGRALHEEAETLAAMRSRVEALSAGRLEIRDYGREAAEAAFVFLVTREERHRALTQALIEASLAFYRQCHAQKREVSWYSFSRINVLAAYDWMYNDLPAPVRTELGAGLMDSVLQEQPTKSRKPHSPRENWLGPVSGFYSTPSLLWYAGIAAYGNGINDSLAERFVNDGYRLFVELLKHRSNAAADDGGSASGALNYSLAAYPWAEFNFFHTFQSAGGRDIAREWPYIAYLPGYIFWNWLPGGREFGYGDAYHTTNEMRANELNLHLSQIIQFYARSKPECAAFAKWLAERMPRERRATFPFARFLLTSTPDVQPARNPDARMPLARRFENMGQTFFRSGSGPDDTYALFTAGGILPMHKQFDHNNFVIYKNGFLALDTGTRPEPGIHLSHYYARTVAHNSILIHMPGEQMPRYWHYVAPDEEAWPVPNDGGQRKIIGSKVVAFESTPQFAYIAGDATETYHEQKCKLALRQFVFLPPNHFIMLDRVTSTRPEYKKTWLLHTAEEPRIDGDTFSAVHEEGKLFSRTLLPEKASLLKIGGPSKQFWSDGRNWPLPRKSRVPDTHPLLGQWRVEVSPTEASTEDVFLHVIEVGDSMLPRMGQTKALRLKGRVGVAFRHGASEWEVLFDTAGPAGGHIKLRMNGQTRLGRELTRDVMPQAGLYGSEP
jgi:heparin/heparan-sulfate lyase